MSRVGQPIDQLIISYTSQIAIICLPILSTGNTLQGVPRSAFGEDSDIDRQLDGTCRARQRHKRLCRFGLLGGVIPYAMWFLSVELFELSLSLWYNR